jgi:phenylpyruvate tautomerase PptA (4-oxalocrotonate tautomerase family)
MPYINSTLTIKVTDEIKEIIKTKLGEIITEIPGKSEEWLMVAFNDDHTMFFRGDNKEKAAFVEIKIFGSADKKHKEAITDRVSTLFEEELSIPKDSIYIIFEEVRDWGWNGKMF